MSIKLEMLRTFSIVAQKGTLSGAARVLGLGPEGPSLDAKMLLMAGLLVAQCSSRMRSRYALDSVHQLVTMLVTKR